MPPSKHAVLSASGAHRWLHCNPSARLELEFADRETETAAEGTAAHALAEHKLKKALKIRSRKPVSPYDCDEMDAHTDGYVEFVLEQLEEAKTLCADPLVLIEQRLDFSCYVPDGFGTGDCLIVADKLLHIIDFKYGQGVLVDAEENPQMMLYALGALQQFDHLYDITQVAMSIYQPRRENVSTCTISVEQLMEWAEQTLKPKAEMAYQGEGDYVPGPWCTFCKAAVKCRARAEAKLQLAKYEFAMPPLLTDAEIEDILSRLSGLTKWAGEIEAYAQDAAIHHGKVWHGFKLVESRTNRKYTDEEAVIRAANAAGYHDIFKKTLIPITEMEKLMGKKAFAEILGSLIEKPKAGRPWSRYPTGVRLSLQWMPPKNLLKLRRYNDMSVNHKNPTKVVTGVVRLSYANIWEPASINGSNPKYSVSLIIPKTDTKTIDAINAAVDAAIKDGAAKFGGKIPNKAALKLPLRDGDLERDDEAYKGAYFVNANSTTAPQIVDRSVQPILDRAEVYSGCYARVSVNFYAFNSNGNRGIACGLGNIQKVRDGEPLGGRSSAADDFATDVDDDFLS